ncbi:MAG: hypothetical protein KF795_05275 [Labilithrix sp.]|nr:hypothetical protein [Labilithrix sp.]
MATKHDGKKLRATVLAAVAAGAILAVPGSAHAEEVTPTAKGIAGGALLGGELVVFGEALFGVRSTTAYLVGAGAGAVAGGVGGYFVEQAVDDGRIPAYMLAGGLALLIPAIVVALDATRYMPTEGAREDKPVDVPPSDPGKPGGSSVVGAEPGTPPATAPGPGSATTPATPGQDAPPPPAPAPSEGGGGGGTQAPRAPQSPQSSLFNLRNGDFYVGVPLPEVRPVLGTAERARMGADNRGSELRFPVVRVTF